MKDLVFKEDEIQVIPGEIKFLAYEDLKKQAEEVAKTIEATTLTEENIKDCKKMLASANKAIKRLNDGRISIKKEILSPYDELAEKIKEIETIVKTADERLRQEIREVEEKEREYKKEKLRKIWDKRLEMSNLASIFTFDDFFEPSMANKTASIAKTEEEMASFIESKEKDIKYLSNLENSTMLINAYRECQDIALASEMVEREIKRQEEVEKAIGKANEFEEVEKAYTLVIRGDKDYKLAIRLLKENEINFEVR